MTDRRSFVVLMWPGALLHTSGNLFLMSISNTAGRRNITNITIVEIAGVLNFYPLFRSHDPICLLIFTQSNENLVVSNGRRIFKISSVVFEVIHYKQQCKKNLYFAKLVKNGSGISNGINTRATCTDTIKAGVRKWYQT